MNTATKFLSVVSALFLLAACETAPNGSGSGTGTGSGAGLDGSGGVNGEGVGELAPGVQDRIFFDYDSSAISGDAEGVLQSQANWLQQNPGVKVVVEGHCDERGTREYNLALGERRATAAKKALVGMGVSASRISTISYGKERPAMVGSDESSWSMNRRAVTVVTN